MQGTVVLGTGEPSPIMKRSPSMRVAKESAAGEKLFSSIDSGTIGRTRRNSIPSLGGGGRMESRGSVPVVLLGFPSQRFGVRSGSITSSKHRSLRSYLRGFGDQNGSSDLSKLDDALAKIRNQLDNMSAETENVYKRVSMLSQDISVLSKNFPSSENTNKKNLTLPSDHCRRAASDRCTSPQKLYNTLPLVLPVERSHSQPPLVQINDVWENQDTLCEGDNDVSDTRVSQDSEEDFEVKVIHSQKLDNHHLIVVSSPYEDLHADNDDDELSDQLEQAESEPDNEDVFDNCLAVSQS